ncbi:MAG: putative GMP synthase [glutamine-hydrolyzing] [Gemmatimonadota bacterium]|nr:MAG: putative GMP synthase [glutamine-hydrolyzing] [Gemmatimonadota bacterium]
MKHDSIAVLDFGGQYVHLIATKIRALGVHAEIRDPDDAVETFRDYRGIVLSGSPALSAFGEEQTWSRGVLDLGIPVLGFCFGHQEIAKHGGGKVEHTSREYGSARLSIIADSPLFAGLDREEPVWMSHGDSVTEIGGDFVELGYATGGADPAHHHRNSAIACEPRRHYGLQFHPEVDDSPCGVQILKNFVLGICGAQADWSVGDQIEERAAAIREEVGDRTVLLLASGGVDSSVAALLFHRAIGAERLHLLHIDNGLMRKDESAAVKKNLTEVGLGDSLQVVDATDEFLGALEGLTEPEAKRKAIGDTFIQVFEREAARLDLGHVVLGQGTIYPDTIETGGSKRAHVIKTHHNRVPLIQEMIAQGRVSEPLKDLYKVEVRELGRALGLDPASIDRHPFPGPGLGIRVAAASRVEDFDGEAIQADLDRELKGSGLTGLPLPVKSVGVKADVRSYEHPVLLCGSDPGWERLTATATSLSKSVHGVNRFLFELSNRAPRTAELVPATVTRERLDLLRELDAVVMGALVRHDLMTTVWQCPTVLVPLRLDGLGRELAVIRPVLSERAMTAKPAWVGAACAAEITEALMAFDDIGAVAIDVTTKPPATIEWE